MQVQGDDKKSPIVIDPEIEQQKPRRLGLRDRKHRRRPSSSEDLILPSVIPITTEKKVEWTQLIQKDELHLIIKISLAQWNINFESQKLGFICSPVKFDIRIVHTIQNQSLSVQIKLSSKKSKESYIDISGKCSWVQNQLQSKLVKANKKVNHQYNNIFKHKIKESMSDVFIDLRFTPLFETSIEFRGLINQGNTCYMNSYLQMLYHIPKLREIVFALEKCPAEKFPRTLQNLFFKLSKSKSKSVSTEQLSKSYGWSKKDTDVQQDIQQFSCLMLEALERKVKEQSNKQLDKDLAKLFGGKLIHYVQCLDGVDYVSQSHENFVDLQLNILGTNNLIDSFKSYMAVELLEGDNMYKIQQHGLCRAEKGVAIETLPEVLMIHLKRFEYDLETGVNKKVLTRYQYSDSVDFSPLLNRKIPPYYLYGVLVHESQKANSGHYYSFVKIKSKWYKFNDEVVTEASMKEVFQHNFGGTYPINILDGRQLTISTSQMEVESTAYMLVYYNSALENQIFGSQDVYPTWLEEQKQQDQNSKSKASEFITVSLTDWTLIKESKVSSCGLISQIDIEEGKDIQVKAVTQLIPNNHRLSQFISYSASINNVEESRINCWIYDVQSNKEILVSPYSISPDPTFQEMFKDKSTNLLVLFCKQKGLIKVEEAERISQDQKKNYLKIETQNMAVVDDLLDEQGLTADTLINVIKLYKVDENLVVNFYFDTYFCSSKQIQFQELKGILAQRYSQPNYSLNYFKEKKNFDVSPLEDQDSLSLSKKRNRMNVVIVQKIHVSAVKSQGLLEHFGRQKVKISVKLKNNDSGETVEKFFPRQMYVTSLRQYINKYLYGCQDNRQSQFVVVKYKPNKNIRNWNQAYNTTIESITKYDKTIVFEKSVIKASERESCGIYAIAFRNRRFEKFVTVNVVAGKKVKSQLIVNKAMEDLSLRKAIETESGKATRLIMMDSDGTKILRHYKQDCDVWSSWNKLKGNLFIQSTQMDNDNCLYGLIHNRARSGQFIGTAFVLQIPKQATCKQILCVVLTRCSKVDFQLQQKKYDFNDQKLKVTVYPKQSSLSKGFVIESDCEVSIQSLFPDHLEFCIEVCHLSIASAVQAMRIEC